MNKRTLVLARGSLIIAGGLLLMESLLGCICVLGIGFSTLPEVLLDLCLTMAFPIYLVGIWSMRYAAIGLWLFFLIQWLDTCLNGSPPGFRFVNPLGWIQGDLLFAAATLVSIVVWVLFRNDHGKSRLRLLDILWE